MAGEWTTIRLGEVCEKIGSGATPRGGRHVYLADGPVALIRSQNVYNDGFHHDGLAYIGERQAAELAGAKVLPGDVLLNITGDSVARACQVDPMILPARVNQHAAIIRPDPERLNPRFLRYVLISPKIQARLLSLAASAGTRNALTKRTIEGLEIPAPKTVGEQRAIAHILGTLDDKIELNRKTAATLEAMARALFRAWFVDFEPVRAKMEGRWRAGESLPGLPAHLYDLFPARLVDSDLGEIPEGWGVRPVDELAEVFGGSTPKTERAEYWASGTHHWATPKDLSRLSVPVLLGTERKITDAGLAQISSGLLPKGVVLLSSRAPIGYLAIAEVPVAINQGLIAMKPRPGTSNLFLLRWTEATHDEIVSHANGSTFLEISKSNFRRIPVVAPSVPLMAVFDRLSRPAHLKLVELERESRTLAAIRDALLPKLVSGELRVKDAEAFLEKAGV